MSGSLICGCILLAVFLIVHPSRKLLTAMLPFILFGIIYDNLRYFPNYEFNDIDIAGLYNAELSLFGIGEEASQVIPSAWCQAHHQAFADFMAGIFYLCWVPVPVFYGIWLFYTGRRDWCVRFGMCFLFVNLLGFIGYYVHPASPPWYVLNYGFEPQFNTPGNVAGMGYFDAMTGIPVFKALYGGNANVFAAMPSLHSAYMLVTAVYSRLARSNRLTTVVFAFIALGIWWAAVYTAHHYILDVFAGIITAIVGILIFERLLMRTRWFKGFFDRYCGFVSKTAHSAETHNIATV